MHYVDEGEGEPLIMLHGNPTWSFLNRHFIKGLKNNYRCIAPDYVGFGLSDKPMNWTFRPEDHSKHITSLIEHLKLKDVTLFLQDWGGPIGMHYAVNHPENVKRLIIFNTWMWSVEGNKTFERFSGLFGSSFGKFMITRMNFFGKVVMKTAFGDKAKFPKSIHDQYLGPLDSPNSRQGAWVFPKEIVGSSSYLEAMWDKRDNIKNKPALILWGMKDIAFKKDILDTWKGFLTNYRIETLDNVGHYVQEEAGVELVPRIRSFLDETKNLIGK